MKQLLIIGFVWPEPTSTAAGSRMLQLINIFIEAKYTITFVSTAAKNNQSYNLDNLGIKSINIELNNSNFNKLLLEINPSIVLFDRYLTEEQFGWRVDDFCPNAIKILDTEDLHFLRYARQLAIKKNTNNLEKYLINDITLREIASIYRCDLTLIISKYEEKLLLEKFNINAAILIYLPFLIDTNDFFINIKSPSFTERKNFMTIGNFKHEPNYQAVINLKNNIWPLIKAKIPSAEMHVYGSYVTEKVLQLQNKKDGFYIKGWIESAKTAFENSRVCLAPIQFGAGLKGKLFEAMVFGTPSVTTSIGAESMHNNLPWNGFIEDSNKIFAEKAIELYTNEGVWKESQQHGYKILKACYSKEKYSKEFLSHIKRIELNFQLHRTNNFMGTMLKHHTLKSTKFMSKWIEEKNKK